MVLTDDEPEKDLDVVEISDSQDEDDDDDDEVKCKISQRMIFPQGLQDNLESPKPDDDDGFLEVTFR